MSSGGGHLGFPIDIKNSNLQRTFPMGKMFQNASSLKPLGQLKPNCPGIIIERSSIKFGFFMPIRNPRWLPPQVIVLTQDHMGKYRGSQEPVSFTW
jgi:hypothetical protein